MNAHVCRRRRVAQQLSSGTTRVWCWIRRGGIPIHVRLGPRPVGWTGRPGLVTHRPTRGHPPALPIGAHAVEASGLSRDVSTQVAASRTLPPHVGVGGRPPSHLDSGGPGHAVPQVPPDSATRASRRCARGARVRDEAHVRGVVARIVTGPHDAQRQNPHRPMRYDTGRPRAVIRFRISQPRTASLPCPAGLRARRPSPMIGATGALVESPGSPTPWMPRPLRGRSWRANRRPSRRPRTGRSR